MDNKAIRDVMHNVATFQRITDAAGTADLEVHCKTLVLLPTSRQTGVTMEEHEPVHADQDLGFGHCSPDDVQAFKTVGYRSGTC